MSPARQPNPSPGGRKVARQISIDPALQTAPNAIGPSLVAKKKRDFDPHAFLATITSPGLARMLRQPLSDQNGMCSLLNRNVFP